MGDFMGCFGVGNDKEAPHMKYVISLIEGYNITMNMFYNLCLRLIDVV
jgi:hypothetical protein